MILSLKKIQNLSHYQSVLLLIQTQCILSAQVSTLRSFGYLSKLGQKKYPNRKNTHRKGLKKMFDEIFPLVEKTANIRSDEHKFYNEFVREYFPKANYQQF